MTPDLDHILPLVKKPGRYTGGELHAISKDWAGSEVRFALVFPDLYEIGMSHFGLQILYALINAQKDMLAERCYAPDIDMEEQLRSSGLPLFSIESRRPLGEFDVIGITLPYELCYTNILTILDLAGLPLRSADRTEGHPLVIGGGSCSMNPEPVADFFDAIVLGDGEEVVLEVGAAVRDAKKHQLDRRGVLAELARIEGVYVPALFEPQYRQDGLFAEMVPLLQGYAGVRRRVLPELPGAANMHMPLVPVVKPVHDRLGIEIARGCTRGCRFCQAGMIYRPVRERTPGDILAAAERGIAESGFEELALLSLSSGDYSCLPEVMTMLMDSFADRYVSVSMPSMRVGTLTPEIMNQIRRVRKTGFTIAPEAGTDRLRQVINKGINETDLLTTCRNAFELGWNLIKFYFMIGLPTETWEDVDAIADLASKARAQAGPAAKRTQINVSVGTFVPKPHTPFQWERQLSLAESLERIDRLKEKLPRRGVRLKWHDPRQSFMEGVFSRGDRRLANLIEEAWRSGVRLDGWSEHFRLENWQRAAERCSITLEDYLAARDPARPLPWDHLRSGVTREYLREEYRKGLDREYTPDCRNRKCQQCGLCDFKTVKPVVVPQCDIPAGRPGGKDIPGRGGEGDEQGISYRVHYARLADSRWYSHLEVLQLIFRALRRCGIRVLHSRGFNPTPRVSFPGALPVGVESEVEFFDMQVADPIRNGAGFLDRLNSSLPPGMVAMRLEQNPFSIPISVVTSYAVNLVDELDTKQQARVESFMAAKEHTFVKIRKGKRREVDIRPLVQELAIQGRTMALGLISHQGRAGIGPREVLQEIIGLSEQASLKARLRKTGITEFAAKP